MAKRYRLALGLVLSLAVVGLFAGCSGEGPRPPSEVNVVENEGPTQLVTIGAPGGPTSVQDLGGGNFHITVDGRDIETLAPVP
ncbi:MAG: hypothetical protein NZ959_01000, partial [Armatimonadetes bacterium]|nr:hypothetical protein [Armatimonadota bacterium]